VRQALGQYVRRDAGDEVLRHQAGGEHPAAGLDALGKPDFSRAQFDRQQWLHRRARVLVSHPPVSVAG
jgi:hypothetical protein